MSFNSRMTFSNDFINARIADVMLETDRRPKPDYMRNEADGQRFLDATQSLLTQEQLQPEAGSMEDAMLNSMGPVLYRVTMLGLIRSSSREWLQWQLPARCGPCPLRRPAQTGAAVWRAALAA